MLFARLLCQCLNSVALSIQLVSGSNKTVVEDLATVIAKVNAHAHVHWAKDEMYGSDPG